MPSSAWAQRYARSGTFCAGPLWGNAKDGLADGVRKEPDEMAPGHLHIPEVIQEAGWDCQRWGEQVRYGEGRVEGGGLLAGTREGKPTCSINSEIGYMIIFLLAPSNYTNTGQWDIYVHRIRAELRVTGNVLHFLILVLGASETRSGQGTNVTQKFYFSSSARKKKKIPKSPKS